MPIYLVGGFNPSEKYEFVSWDDDIYGKSYNSMVPNHQPVIDDWWWWNHQKLITWIIINQPDLAATAPLRIWRASCTPRHCSRCVAVPSLRVSNRHSNPQKIKQQHEILHFTSLQANRLGWLGWCYFFQDPKSSALQILKASSHAGLAGYVSQVLVKALPCPEKKRDKRGR